MHQLGSREWHRVPRAPAAQHSCRPRPSDPRRRATPALHACLRIPGPAGSSQRRRRRRRPRQGVGGDRRRNRRITPPAPVQLARHIMERGSTIRRILKKLASTHLLQIMAARVRQTCSNWQLSVSPSGDKPVNDRVPCFCKQSVSAAGRTASSIPHLASSYTCADDTACCMHFVAWLCFVDVRAMIRPDRFAVQHI